MLSSKVRRTAGLPLRREKIEDALQVGQEAHVQHAVGFVQHRNCTCESCTSCCGMVDSGRGWPPGSPRHGQVGFLGFHVDTAEYHGAAQGQMLLVVDHAFVHLDRQLPVGVTPGATGCAPGALAFMAIIFCSSGSAKAAVLPVPVCACAISRARPEPEEWPVSDRRRML